MHLCMSSRLMQRKFSEPNTYIDGLPGRDCPEELYDDVMSESMTVVSTWAVAWTVGSFCQNSVTEGQIVPKMSSPQATYRATNADPSSFVQGVVWSSLETYLD